jgi:peptidyl-prolyl cis-trans isomerase D
MLRQKVGVGDRQRYERVDPSHIAEEQRRAAFDDLAARIEEEVEEGRSLSELAQDLKLTLASTRPATADGRIYGSASDTVPPVLGQLLQVAFDMEEREAQLAALVPGETYVVFDVTEVTPSAVAPLNEIRDDVIAGWRRDEGSRAARAAADRILARVARGSSLAEAVAAESRPLAAPETLSVTRDQLAAQAQGGVPSQLALFFSMAERTTKKLQGPADAGWYVVRLDDIEAPQVARDDPIVLATMRQLGPTTSNEYIVQFAKAAQREVGVERNPTAIDAVAAQLTGQNNN